MKNAIVLFLMSLSAQGFCLTLDEATELSEKTSKAILISQAGYESASGLAESQSAVKLPRLSLDGAYQYQSAPPTIQVGPAQFSTTDYYNYNIGPTLSYTLWDSGLKSDLAKAAQAQAGAKQVQVVLTKVQVRLATRIAYTKAALSDQVKRLSESAVNLSQSQNSDIRFRHRSGSVSSLDQLTSDSDVLNYKLKLKQSITDFQNALSDLVYYVSDASKEQAPVKIEKLESLDQLISLVKNPKNSEPDSSHPLLKSHVKLFESAKAALDAQKSSYWPTLNFQARSAINYPIGVPFAQVTENTIGLTLNWTLWDFQSTKNLVSSKAADLMTAQYQLEDTKNQMSRDYQKALDQLRSLKQQVSDNQDLVEKQSRIAKLDYQTYQYGRLSYSDVEMANLRLLDAQSRLAATQAQYLIEYFNLKYFEERE